MQALNERLTRAPVVPLVQADDPGVAIATTQALVAGGLSVIEVVLRTDRALECIRAIADAVPEAIVGAGTVLNAKQAEAAVQHGSSFIVSPGLDDGIIQFCAERDLPLFPGIMTPTELQRALNAGLDTVKFFPASIAGGVPALKALSGVFRQMRFMPTGGVSAANLAEFLAIPAVVACGGSWLTPPDAIAAGDYDRVTGLASAACEIAAVARN